MRKIISALVILAGIAIVIFICGYYYVKSNKKNSQTNPSYSTNIFTFNCNDGAMFGYSLEIYSDGTIHFRIPSKPPQTDIVVTRTQIANYGLEYVGNGIDIKDSTSTLLVNLNGKILQNCRKMLPEV